MYRQLVSAGFVSLMLLSLAVEVGAVPVESVPNPRRAYGGWVTDMADLLDASTEAELNRLISSLEARNGAEVAIVTVPDTASAPSPKAFTTRLFNTWRIGKKGRNNGVLVIISRGDRRVEIETGQGVRTLLPDATVKNIIQQQMTPQFKLGNFDRGTLAGSRALIAILNRYTPPGTPKAVPGGQRPTPGASPRISPSAVPPRPTGEPRTSPQPSTIARQPPATSPPSGQSGSLGTLASILVGLGAGGLSVFGIRLYRKSRPLLLEPEGASRVEEQGRDRQGKEKFRCSVCQKPLQKVSVSVLFPQLSEAQRLAQRLGSVAYEGWQCPRCSALAQGRGFHLRSYVLDQERFSLCPTCQELTIKPESQILREPTWNQRGNRLVQKDCKNCGGHWQEEEAMPCLSLPDNVLLLPPQGRSRAQNVGLLRLHSDDRPLHCSVCRYPMTELDATPYLNPAQLVAERLGSVHFTAWNCPTCPAPASGLSVHLRERVLSGHFSTCPNCQELTVERFSKEVERATTYSSGRRLIEDRCHSCGYSREIWETIPKLVEYSSHNHSKTSSDNSFWSSDNSSDSSSSDSSSSDSGSSDFGGGSSDGGGSGDSW
jgi:uncharacterized protein